jgi:hypothetical protein
MKNGWLMLALLVGFIPWVGLTYWYAIAWFVSLADTTIMDYPPCLLLVC